MIQGQKVRITDGTYHEAGDKPTGTIVGECTLYVAGNDEITDTQIETLRAEAAQAGDDVQVELCRRALAGDQAARTKCERAIRDAQARVES